MVRTKYEILLARLRLMMTASGALPKDITDAELLARVRGDTHEDRMKAMAAMTSLVSERFWRAQGL